MMARRRISSRGIRSVPPRRARRCIVPRNCSAPAARSTPRRWPSWSLPPLLSRSRSLIMRSRLPRICWICALSGWHCWRLAGEQREESGDPLTAGRCDCAVKRSRSACCLATASSASLICSARRRVARYHDRARHLRFEPHADRVRGRPLAAGTVCASATAAQTASALAPRIRRPRPRASPIIVASRSPNPIQGMPRPNGDQSVKWTKAGKFVHPQVLTAKGEIHSASGWFSGRARSKAGSARQAASMPTIFGKLVERHLQPARIVHLRHQADVGECHLGSRRRRAPAAQRFERLEAFAHPVMIPRVDRALLLAASALR